VLAATVVPLASGAAGEAGKHAWTSFVNAVRSRFGRDAAPPLTAGDDPGDAGGIHAWAAEVVGHAAGDPQFADWLREWCGQAAQLTVAPAPVANIVADHATVNGGLVQAHTINGGVAIGREP